MRAFSCVLYFLGVLFMIGAPSTGFPDWIAIGPFGGDVEDVNVSPIDPNIALAGTVPSVTPFDGALYRSTDGASTWSYVVALSGEYIYEIEFTPDGTAFIGASYGVWKGDDQGSTWTRLDTGLGPCDKVFEIAINPSDSMQIWAGVSDDCSQSMNVIRSWDGGTTWYDVTPPMASPMSCHGIAFDPDDLNKVYACFGGAFGGSMFWVSIDAGDTWVDRSAGLPDNPLKDVVHDGTRLLVTGGQLFGSQSVGLWESTDDGVTWTPMHDGSWPILSLSDIEVHPDDTDIICLASLGAGVYRTTDGGVTWTFGVGGTSSLALNSVRFAPGSPEIVFLGSLARGVLKSTDSGSTFQSSTVGISNLDTTSVRANPNNPNELAIAFQGHNCGGIYTSLDRGQSWSEESVPGTRWSTVGFHPDGSLYAISDGPSDIAPEGLYRRNPDGTWTGLGPDQGTVYESELFTMRFSQNDPDLILLGGKDFGVAGHEATIWRSDDAGASWTKVFEGTESMTCVTDIEIVEDGTDATMLASWSDWGVAYRLTGALRSIDGGLTWSESSDGLEPGTEGKALSVSPADIHTFYLANENFWTHSALYKTTDAGLTWMRTGFTDEHLYDVVCDRTDDQVLYVMMRLEDRVLKSTDGGVIFSPFGTGLESVGQAQDLAYRAGDNPFLLLATTKGGYMRSLCWDEDGDGYGDEACGGGDCDDSDPEINPGIIESKTTYTCGDGKDNDCDGLIDCDDPDCICGPCLARIVPSSRAPIALYLISSLVLIFIGLTVRRKEAEK